eukprot:CAMPEP_0184542170 /NCGR_PEP_ID=MMETSP0199_2-20130426/1827_1 /TAXON_ID=1112570 /ORGANISM="Thraustochytrium sp., Strain LLF1b" /LENGTH=128 /DNA_ID=CAMNT_0026935937 /DNA_START=37 /DNA_END=423 /DNA_ORIENTATION=+
MAQANPLALDAITKPALESFLAQIPGLRGMLISSQDAVAFGQAWKKEVGSQLPAAVFPVLHDFLSKIELGTLRSVRTTFEHDEIVHVSLFPLVFTFIGSPDLADEVLTSEAMRNKLQSAFEPLLVALK